MQELQTPIDVLKLKNFEVLHVYCYKKITQDTYKKK